MLRHLLNPDEYWGEFVIPTISRDDPAFADQQYWRGTIWPPTNYLVYQGLKAYGLDMVAADSASKSTALFLRIWKNYQLCPENFDSRTGEAGGQRYQSWVRFLPSLDWKNTWMLLPGMVSGSDSSSRKGRAY